MFAPSQVQKTRRLSAYVLLVNQIKVSLPASAPSLFLAVPEKQPKL